MCQIYKATQTIRCISDNEKILSRFGIAYIAINDRIRLAYKVKIKCPTRAFFFNHRNKKIKHPNGCLYFSWRMVRDSNPRWSCPHNGFQDRRIRPLCQPSETVFRRSFNLRFWCSHDVVMFALHFADARSQDTHASPRSANHPKLCRIANGVHCILFFFTMQI